MKWKKWARASSVLQAQLAKSSRHWQYYRDWVGGVGRDIRETRTSPSSLPCSSILQGNFQSHSPVILGVSVVSWQGCDVFWISARAKSSSPNSWVGLSKTWDAFWASKSQWLWRWEESEIVCRKDLASHRHLVHAGPTLTGKCLAIGSRKCLKSDSDWAFTDFHDVNSFITFH